MSFALFSSNDLIKLKKFIEEHNKECPHHEIDLEEKTDHITISCEGKCCGHISKVIELCSDDLKIVSRITHRESEGEWSYNYYSKINGKIMTIQTYHSIEILNDNDHDDHHESCCYINYNIDNISNEKIKPNRIDV